MSIPVSVATFGFILYRLKGSCCPLGWGVLLFMGVLESWDVFPTIRLLASTGAFLACVCRENVTLTHTYLARFSRWSIWPRLHDWSSSCTPRGPFVVGPSGVRQGLIFVRLRTRALRDLGTYANVCTDRSFMRRLGSIPSPHGLV